MSRPEDLSVIRVNMSLNTADDVMIGIALLFFHIDGDIH
jgi:hypothetical protein